MPTNVTEVRSFHGLTLFYRWAIKDFGTFHVTIMECMKKSAFKWSKTAQSTFEMLKIKLFEAPILALQILTKSLKQIIMIVSGHW